MVRGTDEGLDRFHGAAVVVTAGRAVAGLDVGRAVDLEPGVGVGVVDHGDQTAGRGRGSRTGAEHRGGDGGRHPEPG
ncbi:hypothetical protein ADK64_06385 [Streptomyces sp. MMG1121]|nr:hypothetical protein ADK64_06385 [Streptomyces sp. MMG1121]